MLPDGRGALSGSEDGTVLLWDLETGAELRRFEGHQSSVSSVAVLPDGRRALSAGNDKLTPATRYPVRCGLHRKVEPVATVSSP